MVLEECPTTQGTNRYWNEKIIENFPLLINSSESKFLSLKEYMQDRPQKFYNDKIFTDFYSLLINFKENSQNSFIHLYRENEHNLNIAIKSLDEINNLQIHDIFIPENEIEVIQFIENNIHFNYLKLLESVYHKFIHIIAFKSRKERDKPTDGLDIFNCVEEIKNTDFNFCTLCYNNTVRNGIAHGGIIYEHSETTYKGKRGKPHKINTKKVIRYFDDLLDICNGFSLAFKIFLINNRDFFQEKKLPIPKHFLIQELKAQANAPKWEVVDCLESIVLDGKKQLNIFTNNKLLAHEEVNYYAFRTAVLAEYFATGYDRYFFSLNSKYSINGWAAYNGLILKKGRILNNDNLNDYKEVLEGNLLYFIPKIKIPKFIRSLINLFSIIKSNFQIEYHKITNNIFKKKYEIRDTKPFRRGFSIIINDPSIYILPEFESEIINMIQEGYKKIISYSIKQSKKRLKYRVFKFLPTSYIRITIYEKDLRKRQLRSSGLIENLVCSITVNNSNKIKNIDFIGGKVEQKGKYRIVWNKNWNGIKYVC